MRLLITGVSGPSGRDVSRLLLAAGHQVVGLTAEPHRYLDPRIELVVADHTDTAAWTRAIAGCDAVVHLADGGLPTLVDAARAHGVRVVLPLSPEEAAELPAAGLPMLVVRTAPVVGRRVDPDTLRTLAGLLAAREGSSWQVLHHDDLARFLAHAAVGDATGEVELVAPGTVTRGDVLALLRAAGLRPTLPGVRPRRAVPELTGRTTPADRPGCGFSAHEAVEDAVRGLVGRDVTAQGATQQRGRFALPAYVVPNNLPASDGGTLVPAGPPELQGEFDTLIDPRFPVLTATNASEALPRPMTPMTLDLQMGAIRVANEDMGRMLALEGAALEQQTSLVMGIFGHSVYINASVGVNIVENMPGWDEASVRRDAYGHIDDDIVFRPEGGPPMPQGLAARKATLTATLRTINRARKFKEEAERLNAAARAETLSAAEVAELDDAALQTRVLLWRDRLAQGWSIASIGVMFTGAAAAMHYRSKKPEPVAIDVEQLESARTMLAVERLAAALRGDDRLIALARAGKVDALRAASAEVARLLDSELAVMGHRGPGECELENPVFADRPSMLVASAAGAAQQPPTTRTTVTPPRSRTGRMSAGATLARERARDGVVRYTHCLRLGVREQGRRLHQRGLLEKADDVFYLTLDEAFAVPGDLRDRVVRRRAERIRFQAIRMPDVVVGHWEPEGSSAALEVGGTLSGTGVSPGVVEGRVRVLRTPDDDIEPGDVLVASVTDVGHTAMFGYASAVVTDIGGAASHAAIVAREFCIPCVVDTKHGTDSLQDGQLVRVDGATGTVTLLAEAGMSAAADAEVALR